MEIRKMSERIARLEKERQGLPRLRVEGRYSNDMSIGYLEGKPVFIDDQGYAYVQEEGTQISLDSGNWCARVQDGEWKVFHRSCFPYGKFDYMNPVENGADYDPDDYIL